MKKPKRNRLTILALVVIAFVPLHAGTEILLYPFARAFGSPPESELAKCRQAFTTLQGNLERSRLLVQPVLTRPNYAPATDRGVWRHDLAEAVCRELGKTSHAKLESTTTIPTIPSTKFGANQMRYLWQRAGAVAKWVRSNRPAVDYILFAEVFSRDGRVGAIQVFLLDASGQLAYARLFNSHHFGDKLPADGDAAVRLLVKRLLDDVGREAKTIFPPYGVG